VRAVGVQSLTGYANTSSSRTASRARRSISSTRLPPNKTDFFREPDHFRFLVDQAIPELMAAQRGNGRARR